MTFNVKVKALVADGLNAVKLDDVTTDVTLSGAATGTGSSASAIKLTFANGYAGGNVTASATYGGETGTATIATTELKAGGKASYDILVVVGTRVELEDKTVVFEKTSEGTIEKLTTYLEHTKGYYQHDGYSNWIENASEYILTIDVNYQVVNYQKLASKEIKNDVADALINSFVNAMSYGDPAGTTATETLMFSAWSVYQVWVDYTKTTGVTYKFSYEETGEELGTVVFDSAFGTSLQFDEKSHPGHSHFYHFGHGHGAHGDSANSGGGIVLPD